MKMLYECCLCGAVVEHAWETENSQGYLVFLCDNHFEGAPDE